VCRVRNLSNEHAGYTAPRRGCSDENTPNDIQCVVMCRCLSTYSYKGEEDSDVETWFSTKGIGHPRLHGITKQAGQDSDGVYKPKPGASGIVHEALPLLETHESVHHAPFVTHGSGPHEE
jgi:hypothetical protein